MHLASQAPARRKVVYGKRADGHNLAFGTVPLPVGAAGRLGGRRRGKVNTNPSRCAAGPGPTGDLLPAHLSLGQQGK